MNNKSFNKSGTEYINSLIKEAIENETRTATVTGAHEIAEAVRIPSNFTLILEDCHLRLKDGTYTNVFVNEHHDTDLGRTINGTDRNISIIGRGEAIIDGGEFNGLGEKVPIDERPAPIWKNNLILFTNVDGFKISGISCINQRWWATNFVFCRNGYIGNIDFCSNDTCLDKNGNVYHGLSRRKHLEQYRKILVKNSDGIDLRQGCHDILIENITGFTEDDTVALTGLNGNLEKHFKVEGLSTDIYNVTIKNIASAAFCSNVRLLNQSGVKLHDITVDGVTDTSDTDTHLDGGNYAVRVGDKHLYGTRHSTEDETYNITVKNVLAKSECAIVLAGAMKNFVMYGIECQNGCKKLIDYRGQEK